MTESISAMLKRHEGKVTNVEGNHVVYDDATGRPLRQGDTIIGHPTIGYGQNVAGHGIPDWIADLLLYIEIRERTAKVRSHLYWFDDMPPAIQRVIINMSFQLGIDGLMKFRGVLGNMEKRDFAAAADGMLNSLWARQTPARVRELADIVLSHA